MVSSCDVCGSTGHPSWAHPVQCAECKVIGGHSVFCSQHSEDTSDGPPEYDPAAAAADRADEWAAEQRELAEVEAEARDV